MPYLIDGHNLIPKMPGLCLKSIDDEIELINILQAFCRIQRKKIEVYFDQAPAGYSGKKCYGLVTAHFIAHYSTADSAIISRLHASGKAAKQCIVITSDRQIQVEARLMGAKVIPSEDFAKLVIDLLNSKNKQEIQGIDVLTEAEVNEWLHIFKTKNNYHNKMNS